jgi:preprotein translocase subunit SecB
MDASKQPGIVIEKISLFECQARVLDLDVKLRFNMGLAHLTRQHEGNNLIVMAAFDMMQGIDKPPCVLKCTFVAVYSRTPESNMQWSEFTDVMAVTHLIPYVREFVSSVTLRMPIKELILPPINVNILVAEYQAMQHATPPKPQVGKGS